MQVESTALWFDRVAHICGLSVLDPFRRQPLLHAKCAQPVSSLIPMGKDVRLRQVHEALQILRSSPKHQVPRVRVTPTSPLQGK